MVLSEANLWNQPYGTTSLQAKKYLDRDSHPPGLLRQKGFERGKTEPEVLGLPGSWEQSWGSGTWGAAGTPSLFEGRAVARAHAGFDRGCLESFPKM